MPINFINLDGLSKAELKLNYLFKWGRAGSLSPLANCATLDKTQIHCMDCSIVCAANWDINTNTLIT